MSFLFAMLLAGLMVLFWRVTIIVIIAAVIALIVLGIGALLQGSDFSVAAASPLVIGLLCKTPLTDPD